MSNTDDLKTHEEMWHNFIKLITYSTIGVVTLLVLMAIFLL